MKKLLTLAVLVGGVTAAVVYKMKKQQEEKEMLDMEIDLLNQENESEENEMGFVRERVSFEDWNLYNSFKLVSKADSAGKMQVADKYSVWILNREREIYFI